MSPQPRAVVTSSDLDAIATRASRIGADLHGLTLEIRRLQHVDAERHQLAALTTDLVVASLEAAIADGLDPDPAAWAAARWLIQRGLVPVERIAHLCLPATEGVPA